MSDNETSFAVVVRGYERGAVDDAIIDLRKELLKLSALNSQLATELREANKEVEELQRKVAEVGEPNYASLGARATLILATAEEQSVRLVREAQDHRNQVLHDLNLETEDIRREAQGFYEALVAEAQKRAERLLSATRLEAEQIIADARSSSLRQIDEATREAGSIRGAIATEVAKLRATTKRQTEKLKTSIERELAERKLVALRENTRELDMNRASELISEQSRIDLELELTARRDEAEAEYLQKHQEAVAATQKYLDDANSQLALALNRVSAARLEAETLEAAAKSVNKASREEAKAQSEAIVAAAEAEARVLTSNARLEASKTQREALAKLSSYQVELESLTAYIDNLADLVTASRQKISKDQ